MGPAALGTAAERPAVTDPEERPAATAPDEPRLPAADAAVSGTTVPAGAATADADGAGVAAVCCRRGTAACAQPGLTTTDGMATVVLRRPAAPSAPPDDNEPAPPDEDEPAPPDEDEPAPPDEDEPTRPDRDDDEPAPPDEDEPALVAGVTRAQAWAAACSAATPTYGAGTRTCGMSSARVAPAAFQAYASRTPRATGATAEINPAPPFLLSRRCTLIPQRLVLLCPVMPSAR